MNSLNFVIKEVYSYINSLTLNSKIKLLQEITGTNVINCEKDLEYVENYVNNKLQWLKMSEIDYLFNKINKNMEQKNIKDLINVTLCGRNNTCCPVLSEQTDSTFTITDDYNGKVILTKDELILLRDTLNEKLK